MTVTVILKERAPALSSYLFLFKRSHSVILSPLRLPDLCAVSICIRGRDKAKAKAEKANWEEMRGIMGTVNDLLWLRLSFDAATVFHLSCAWSLILLLKFKQLQVISESKPYLLRRSSHSSFRLSLACLWYNDIFRNFENTKIIDHAMFSYPLMSCKNWNICLDRAL